MRTLEKIYDDMTKVNKGWSNDEKYLVTYQSQTCFLRISPIQQQSRVERMIAFMRRVDDLSIPICKPVDYKVVKNNVHAFYTYVNGKDLNDVLHTFSKEDKYRLGMISGEYLKKIHTIDMEANSDLWAEKFNKKIDHKIKRYRDSKLEVPEIELFINYVNSHRDLLLNRPQTMHHGDYHVGNFMLDETEKLVIIDFEKHDFGDPWEEFNRIVWSAQESHEFASGMIDGYFQHDIPDEFWKLLLLYISNNTISSLPWGLALNKEQYQVMLNQMYEILDWYENLKEIIPTWYIKKNR
ncbi:hypothetical protein BK011_02965 [Tenericutes bacterium MZ-XQ]|nr:hypothetical protein BK011_02965 [Tenericutes bacterium MZ-XQ]